nr:hypothetical protein [uncultured Pseudodesulfovibrio sp.]
MREFWTFIGGVAVGILAVTGVFATEEGYKPRSIENDENETEELEDGTEKGTDGDGECISQPS